MKRIVLAFVGTTGFAVGLEATASAQVCSGSPGTVTIVTNTPTTLVKQTNGTIKANSQDCGPATAVVIEGWDSNDTITLNYVPPSIPVSTQLGAGKNVVVLYGTSGGDHILGLPTGADRDGDSVQDLTFDVLPASFLVHGKPGDDILDFTASGMKVSIYAEPGNDTVLGSAFNDSIELSTGDDYAEGGLGNDRINGAGGNDTIIGGDGNDTFVVGKNFDGFDSFNGGGGTDNISYASRTVSLVLGNADAEDSISDDLETIKGGKAGDTLDFATAALAHNLYGGTGNDLIRGGAGADKLYGDAGHDNVYGGPGLDKLYGGDGTDSLIGGDGKDTYDGGPGGDTLETDDGVAETVQCGADADEYLANALDTFPGCELPRAQVALPNGSFETGDYTSWTVVDLAAPGGPDIWGIGGDGAHLLPGDALFDFESGTTQFANCVSAPGLTMMSTDGVQNAFEIQYFASDHRMYQDVVVPATATTLNWDLGFQMSGPFDANQVLRVHVRDPGTDAILATLYTSADPFVVNPGGGWTQIPTLTYTADVSAFAGQTVRIDFEVVVHMWCTPLQIDNLRFFTTVGAPFAPDDLVPPLGTLSVRPSARDTASPRRLEPVVIAPALGEDDTGDDDGELDEDGLDLDGDAGDDELAEADDVGGCSTSRGGGSLATGVLLGLALIIRRRKRS